MARLNRLRRKRAEPLDILIVEDDRQTHDALVALFKRLGYTTRGVTSCGAALREIEQQVPRFLLTDWDLGEEISGIDIAAYAQSKSSSCTIVFFTGNSVRLLKQQTAHLNVSRYLKKPVSLTEFRSQWQSLEHSLTY